MILPVSHICSRENNFLFKHVKVQLKIAKLLRRVIMEKLETVLQLSNIYILNDISVHHRQIYNFPVGLVFLVINLSYAFISPLSSVLNNMHDKMIDGFYRYNYWKNLQVSREKVQFLANLF